MPSSSPLLYYVFFYIGVREWTSNTSSPCVLLCCIFTLFCLRMLPYGIHCNFKYYVCQSHPHSLSTILDSFYSSPVYSIWHFCSGRLPYAICDIFSQCVVYEKLFSTGLCKRKKKCKTVSLKSSVVPVVHLDLHTVGGTWGCFVAGYKKMCLSQMRPLLHDNPLKDADEDWILVFLSWNIYMIPAAVKLPCWADLIQFTSKWDCNSLSRPRFLCW